MSMENGFVVISFLFEGVVSLPRVVFFFSIESYEIFCVSLLLLFAYCLKLLYMGLTHHPFVLSHFCSDIYCCVSLL